MANVMSFPARRISKAQAIDGSGHEVTLDLVEIERQLTIAFAARYGPELGQEVTAEAIAWAWENRSKLEGMHNPSGYLFRVGQSKSRRLLRWKKERVRFPAEQTSTQSTWSEPGLPAALARLKEEERTAVVPSTTGN